MNALKRIFSLTSGCVLAIAVLLAAGCASTPAYGAPFAKGADVSWLSQLQSLGYTYVSNGTSMSALQILKNDGVNTIRLRTLVNPSIQSGVLGVGDCNQAGTIAEAKLAASMGFQIDIDFHYSDTWADPGHQTIPAAWSGETYNQLKTSVYYYTYDFMVALKNAGVTPAWVEVGNEINSGLLWPTGKYTNFAQLTGLVNEGYYAVKNVSSSTQVVVHLATLSNLSDFEWFFDNFKANGGLWDVIGASYYDGPGTLSSIKYNMNTLTARYGKPILICEIGHASSDLSGSETDLSTAVSAAQAVPNGMGEGVIWWEPEAPDNSTTSDYSMGAVSVYSGKELEFTGTMKSW